MSAADTVTVPGQVRGRLAATARGLAQRGADGRTALAIAGPRLVAEVGELLRGCVRPPDRQVGYLVVAGLFDFPPLGPTPAHWSAVGADEDGRAADIALVLAGAALGVPFGWSGQQDGRLVNNVLPSRADEDRQVGASSTVELAWHTEDAFHPERADLVLLACVRNPEGVGSRVANLRRCALTEPELDLLTRPLWRISPDDSYGQVATGGRIDGTAPVERGPDGLLLCYDPSYTEPDTDDPKAAAAYQRLGAELDRCAVVADLHPGDLLVLDNAVVAHSRAPFRARYDGTDRWLKRIQVHTSARTGTRTATPGADRFVVSRVEPLLHPAEV